MPEEPFWEDDDGEGVPSVLHVYALDADGMAWDALGPRPVDAIEAHLRQLFPDARAISLDRVTGVSGLMRYVDVAVMADRPLHEVAEADVIAAMSLAERLLGSRAVAFGR